MVHTYNNAFNNAINYHDATGRVCGELLSVMKHIADVTLRHILQEDLPAQVK